MHWILVALVAPLIWSFLNHADKYLISKYSNNAGVAGLAIFSSLFAVFALPVIYIIDSTVFSLPAVSTIAITISGILLAFCVFLYLHALDHDDTSHVVPFWFLTPMFAYVLGIIFLGEYIHGGKVLGSIITLVGALILSLEFDKGVKVKKAVTILMVFSSMSVAGSDTIFKYFVNHASFSQAIFWNQVGFVIFGVALLSIKKYRSDFRNVLKMKSLQIVSINVIGELGQTIAVVVNTYALLLAPIALVTLVNYTFQPLFVFIIGILITRFFPKIAQEHLTRRHITQKVVSMVIMSIGVYLIMI